MRAALQGLKHTAQALALAALIVVAVPALLVLLLTMAAVGSIRRHWK